MKYPGMTLGRVEAIINKLGGEEGVKRFLSGQTEVVAKVHIIDCDAEPFVPQGWSVEEHQKAGQFEWSPERVQLYLSANQRDGKSIRGHDLREELRGQAVLNTNVLDYLLNHPHLIPEEWKDKSVFFWGTVYRFPDGALCVRYLGWRGASWRWSFSSLNCVWDSGAPAAVLASV